MRVFYFYLLSVTCMASMPVLSAEQAHEHQHHQPVSPSVVSPLSAPGNDAFAAIQEVVAKLLSDPKTDWSKINLEALRQHLVDMHHFTLNVEILNQKNIDEGIEFTVKATLNAAAPSLNRLFSAHPAIMKQESGWNMSVTKNSDGSYTARVTTDKAQDVARIRGLGYIGLIALGQHHQVHHWQMATGVDPHHGH